jgi:hypothetical protein
MTEAEFRAHVAALVEESCGSAGALARKHKVHPKALTLFLSGARGPSVEVAAAFGFERRYAPIASAESENSAASDRFRSKDTESNRSDTPVIVSSENSAAIPAGWVLMPREPTEAMIAAYNNLCLFRTPADEAEQAESLRAAWSAMLSASPSQEQSDRESGK